MLFARMEAALTEMKAKVVREATMERMKIIAAHANDIAMLQVRCAL